MFHKQSMDMLLPARNVALTRALNYAFRSTLDGKMAKQCGNYEGEDGGSRVA